MIRFIALTAVLFAVPFAVYIGWLGATQRRLPVSDDWPTRRLLLLCVIGAVFVLIGLVILVLSSDLTPVEPVPFAMLGAGLA